MAIHANRGVIRITSHAGVKCIGIRLVRVRRISCMAGTDTGEHRIGGRADMAISTHRAIVRNPEGGMVEYHPEPCGSHVSSVAANASRRV